MVIGADDLDQARRFYDRSLAELGIAPPQVDGRGRLVYRHGGVIFIVGRPIDGCPATHANGGTLGFHAPSADAVVAWHRTGLANGGRVCEGEPEKRTSPATGRDIWVAYLRDPAGNKLCAAFDTPD